jgi:D-arabinan exo alpha-(1,3)/(1,5)-arabinofuranosidase (non-reducing end)
MSNATLLTAVCLLVSAALPGTAQIDQPQTYRAARASSYRTNGANGDAKQVPAGGSHTVADIKGAGRIVHTWFTIATNEPDYLNTTRLKIYWDGSDSAAVDVPFGLFHAQGHGVVRQLNSAFVTVRARPELNHNLANKNVAGFNTYFPMPYAKGARVVIENTSDREIRALYYQVDYQEWERPPSPLRFHAAFRETPPDEFLGHEAGRATSRNVDGADNHLVMETAGKGHFIGMVLSVDGAGRGWWEGDEMMWVDGENHPSIYGTGTEDYFGGAWGFRGEYNMPYHGVSVLQKTPWREDWQAGRFTVYRFHELDPVPFGKSIKVSIERGHNNHRRDSTYRSIAYWYQQ